MRKININPVNSPVGLIGQHNLSHRIRQQKELAERVSSNTQLNIILEWIFWLCCILRFYATNYKNGEENQTYNQPKTRGEINKTNLNLP